MKIKSIKGVKDILPGEIEKWQWVEAVAHRIFSRYGFKEIRPPIFEYTDLFKRSIGDTTDIVEKEMYTFKDKGGEEITLRPEGTASVRPLLHRTQNARPESLDQTVLLWPHVPL